VHEGLPVREPDYQAHPPLERILTLPAEVVAEPAAPADALSAWAGLLGEPRIALVRGVERARALLLRAMAIQPGEPIALAANASRSVVEAIKRHGARPMMTGVGADLRPSLGVAQAAGARLFWRDPPAGLAPSMDPGGLEVWLDHADSLPRPTAPCAETLLWGLHLGNEASEAGALVRFADSQLHAAFVDLLTADDLPDPGRALAQCRRLAGRGGEAGLAARQLAALDETRWGVEEAAGLPVLPLEGGSALAHHVAVQIPSESDPSTFYAYVLGENTPVRWLPEVRPIHPAALYESGAEPLLSAANLARWLLIPVGPDYTAEELRHAVLAVVKAAEYLGVRWRTAPARAAEYARQMDELYGPGHDAYRPVFDCYPDG
jgi:hypothetical protein